MKQETRKSHSTMQSQTRLFYEGFQGTPVNKTQTTTNQMFCGGPGGGFSKKPPGRRRLLSTTLKSAFIGLTLILFLISCTSSQRKSTYDVAAIAANNRGAALMGQFKYNEARQVFEELTKKYPQDGIFQTNLAIATLNRQEEGDEQAALSILEGVLKQNPENIRARYCAGLLELYRGKPAEALNYFQTLLKSDPEDAELLYFTGKALMQLNRHKEAIEFFKRTIEKDAYIRSAYYGMIMVLRQQGKADEAYSIMEQFQKLEKNPRSRLVEFRYTKMGRKAEVLSIDQPVKELSQRPTGPLFNGMKAISVEGQSQWRQWKRPEENNLELPRSSISICDINNDLHWDIFISGAVTGVDGVGNAVLLANPQEGQYVLDSHHPLAGVTGVNAVLWGDINNDGVVDAYLCRRGPNQLWYQDSSGQWQEVTRESAADNGDLDTVEGALFDADHDGDLDIFLVNADGPNELLNNNRDGTFRPLAGEYGLVGNSTPSRSIVITDIDNDGDADIIIINQSPPHEVYVNQLLWKYTPASGVDSFISAGIIAAVAGDVNTDGHTELYTLNTDGTISRWQPNGNSAWEQLTIPVCEGGQVKEDSANQLNTVSKNNRIEPDDIEQAGLALTDVDGDGQLDLIVSTGKEWWVGSFDKSCLNLRFTESDTKNFSPLTWAVLNTGKGPTVVGWAPGQSPLLWSAGSGRFPFVTLQLTGRKDSESQWRSNASGIGTRVSARVGTRWTVLDSFRNYSGPGQGLQPVILGLGDAKNMDYVALDWSDGVFQTEMNLEPGKVHRVVETERQISSCPVLFAWNGTAFEFVSDLLGVGGIGYAVGPGEYTQSRPWENFMIPEGLLQSRNKRFLLKITEPMEEVTYLDAIRLKAYDLPPGWSMTLDERMGINGPEPTGQPYFYRTIVTPLKVVNDRNDDVTACLAQRDLVAAPPGKLDQRFIGRLEQDHILTVTFPRPLDSYPGEALLVIDGWVEYPYSQTNFAAWQAGADYRAATLEILRPNGKWEVLLEQFGYPAGMPRQMSVPLPSLPVGTTQFRIRTNQEIYWDRFAVAFAEPCPQEEHHELKLEVAQLEQIGFPQRTTGEHRLPGYDYEKRRPFWDTRFLEGFYTRFGNVEELVETKDNAVAIFGAGEGVHVEFNEPTTPINDGWTRIYVLETDGWCKDMDFYTRTGETIEPVPYMGNRDSRIEALHRTYNTRYLSGRQ